MIDLEAICDALAARFAPGTISTPTGASAMRASYSETPKSVAATPAVVLEVQEGTVVANPGQWKHEIGIDVVLLIARRQGDTVRVETARRKWLPSILAATTGQLKLGLAAASGYTVDKAIPSGWAFEEYDAAGTTFDAARVSYTVYVTENVTLTP